MPLSRKPANDNTYTNDLDYDLDNDLYEGRPCYNAWSRDYLEYSAAKWGIDAEGLSNAEICLALRNIKELEYIDQEEVDIDEVINIPNDRSNFEKFRGNIMWEWGWLLYLYSVLPEGTMCLVDIQTPSSNTNAFIYNEDAPSGPELMIEDWVEDVLEECGEQYRFSVAILNIHPERGADHANAIIFDHDEYRASRFEPHGSAANFYNADILDDLLHEYVTNLRIGGEKWEYISLSSECGRGPQAFQTKGQKSYIDKMSAVLGNRTELEAEGFCSVWTLMFIHLRMLNPNVNDEDIVYYMSERSGIILNDMVRRYASFIVNNVDENWPLSHKMKMMNIGDFVVFKYKGKEYDGVIYDMNPDRYEIIVVVPDKIEDVPGRFFPIPVKFVDMNDKGNYEDIRRKIRAFATNNVISILGWD